MTLNPTENGTATYKKVDGGKGGFMLTSVELLNYIAGKKIKSAAISTGINSGDKDYCGLIIQVEGINLNIGVTSWELRTLFIKHYFEEGKFKAITLDSDLQTYAKEALLSCQRDEEEFLKIVRDKIIGKFCGCLNYIAWANKKKVTYPYAQILLFASEQESYIQTAE